MKTFLGIPMIRIKEVGVDIGFPPFWETTMHLCLCKLKCAGWDWRSVNNNVISKDHILKPSLLFILVDNNTFPQHSQISRNPRCSSCSLGFAG